VSPVCAVVDAYSTGRFLAPVLRRHGVATVHVRSTPEIPEHLRNVSRVEDFIESIVFRNDVQPVAARLARRGVTHVVAGTETGVSLADSLSAALGTPGHGASCPAARRDKSLMAERLRRSGLDAPHGLAARTEAEVLAWLAGHGRWPVVLKPLDSAGGDNVQVCPDRATVLAAFRRIMAARNIVGHRNQRVLLQEFLTGEELFVNTVSWAGRHHVAEVWKYVKRRTPDGAIIYDYEEPLPPDDRRVSAVFDYVVAVLDALEIRNGAAHTEVILTLRGPVLVDSGARLAGSVLPHVVSRCFGTSQVELLATAIAAPERFASSAGRPYRLGGHLRYVSLICPRDCALGELRDLEKIRRLSTFADLVFVALPGDAMRRTTDSATSPGQVYLFGDPEDIARDYRRLRDLEAGGLYES
jgi:biotin carboxylase